VSVEEDGKLELSPSRKGLIGETMASYMMISCRVVGGEEAVDVSLQGR
jgi:hypothetical protein